MWLLLRERHLLLTSWRRWCHWRVFLLFFLPHDVEGAIDNVNFLPHGSDGVIDNVNFLPRGGDGVIDNVNFLPHDADGVIDNVNFLPHDGDGVIDEFIQQLIGDQIGRRGPWRRQDGRQQARDEDGSEQHLKDTRKNY